MIKKIIFICCACIVFSCNPFTAKRLYTNALKCINENDSMIRANSTCSSMPLFRICDSIYSSPDVSSYSKDVDKFRKYFYDVPTVDNFGFRRSASDSLSKEENLKFNAVPIHLSKNSTSCDNILMFHKFNQKYRVLEAIVHLEVPESDILNHCKIQFHMNVVDIYYIFFFNKKGKIVDFFIGKGIM